MHENTDLSILESPLSEEERKRIDEKNDGHVSEIIKVDLADIVDMSMEEFYDYLSNRVVGHPLLHEISYGAVEVMNSHAIYLRVTGYLPED